MQVSVEAGEGLERRMRVDLPFDEIAVEVDKRLQTLGRSARLPGFRPGKVPMKLLRSRYGMAVHQEVFAEKLDSIFSEAVTGESLRPAGRPRIEPDIDLDERRMGFTAIFEILPQVTLADLTEQVIKIPSVEVTEADLEQMIQRLREQRATWIPVERASQLGDRLSLSFDGTLDGEPFEGGAAQGVTIELGSSRMIPGFEEGLIGAAAGEQRALDLVFPEQYHVAHLAGRPVHFDVTVDSVTERVLPEVDAELAKAFEVEDGDVERFRAEVRQNMLRELKQRLDARKKDAVMDLLFAMHPIELPRALVENETRAMATQMRESLGSTGMNIPDGMFDEPARRRVALGLIIGEIVRQQGMRPDAERVRSFIQEMASTYEEPQRVVDHYYRDENRLAQVEGLVLENQVVDWVMEQARVEEESMTFAQLSEPPTR
ncbi:MAG: trigger factor [Sphingobacteriia bacterium]|nr:trigger factor [Sphingobacteriia bacterium]NCC38950.1 trigger factor [Gammaproteobacteria bacterium]